MSNLDTSSTWAQVKPTPPTSKAPSEFARWSALHTKPLQSEHLLVFQHTDRSSEQHTSPAPLKDRFAAYTLKNRCIKSRKIPEGSVINPCLLLGETGVQHPRLCWQQWWLTACSLLQGHSLITLQLEHQLELTHVAAQQHKMGQPKIRSKKCKRCSRWFPYSPKLQICIDKKQGARTFTWENDVGLPLEEPLEVTGTKPKQTFTRQSTKQADLRRYL